MNENQDPLKTLEEIRAMMARSSRFMSLSGWSGIFSGLFAMIGVGVFCLYFDLNPFTGQYYNIFYDSFPGTSLNTFFFFLADAMVVLALSIAASVLFTTREARRKGIPVWGPSTRLLLSSFSLPLIVGGIFCLSFIYFHLFAFLAPATLVFYGLALANCGKYTLKEVTYLGYAECALGLMACFLIDYGLVIWVLGFGLLHVIYGSAMYLKYESADQSGQ